MAADRSTNVLAPKLDNPDAKVTTRYDNLEWVHLNEVVLPKMFKQEGLKEKLIRKTKENPFVPIGTMATVAALSLGLWSMRGNKTRTSQLMMRFRIGAQGFTIVAILVGLAMGTSKTN